MAATVELDAPPVHGFAGGAGSNGAIAVKQAPVQVHSCPECGNSNFGGGGLEEELEKAYRRIRDLEAQVELLKDKATAAVDRCADFEDQLRLVRSQPQRTNTSDSLRPSSSYDDRPSSSQSTRTSRFSFLTGRRASPAQPPPPAPSNLSTSIAPFGTYPSHSHSLSAVSTTSSSAAAEAALLSQLEKERQLVEKERQLRAQAEEKAKKVDMEIEELTAHLFSQANEMVAAERKARVKLEKRVEVLEGREREKMMRLERLEGAVARVERVKGFLATGRERL